MKPKKAKNTRGKTPRKRPPKPFRPVGRPKFLFDQLTPCEHSPTWWRVLESRVTQYGCRRRRWKCLHCGTRWTTREHLLTMRFGDPTTV